MSTVRVAVFDLGSSSFHLMVVDATRDGTLAPVMRHRSFLHLGAEVTKTGGIPADRAEMAIRSARRLRAAADGAGADTVVALGTAALRDASNGSRLVARLERAIGHPISLLSGDEEARLCFFGQRAGVWVGRRPVLGIDLGGGSLEAAVGDATTCSGTASVALGTARLRGECSIGTVLSSADRGRIAAVTGERLAPVAALVAAHRSAADRVIASGGTVRALARLAMNLHRPPPTGRPSAGVQVNQVELPADQLHELAARLSGLDLEARLALPGMQERRALLLPIGAAVISELVAILGLDRLVVSDWGLREGAVLDALGLPG